MPAAAVVQMMSAVWNTPGTGDWPGIHAGTAHSMHTTLALFSIHNPEPWVRRIAGSLLASFFLHLAVLLGVGHMLPFAAAWQAPSFQLTVSLAAVPGQTARGGTLPRRKIPKEVRSEPQSVIEVTSTAPATAHEAATPAPHHTAATPTAAPEYLVSMALPPGVHYFPSKEVDVPAQAINDVMLHYPLAAFRQGIAGEVKLRVFINEKGTVDDATVTDAEPKRTFDDAAIAAARQLLYTPAMKDGLAVKSIKAIAIVFDPSAEPLR